MPTITCQYTGLEFEAATRRSKNHPDVSALLNEAAANKHNPSAYAAAKAALEQGRQRGFTTIEDFIAYARAAINVQAEAHTASQNARYAAEAEAKQAAREARARRDEQNRVLREHGYRWVKEVVGSEDDWLGAGSYSAGIGEAVGSRWQLYAPDGRAVSVAEAMAQIEN